MTVHWQNLAAAVVLGAVSLIVLRLVVRSLRTGINDWVRGGPYKRSPGDYDYWTVAMLFTFVACVFLVVSILSFSAAFR